MLTLGCWDEMTGLWQGRSLGSLTFAIRERRLLQLYSVYLVRFVWRLSVVGFRHSVGADAKGQ